MGIFINNGVDFGKLAPPDLHPDDLGLVKEIIAFTASSNQDIKQALWSHSRVESTAIYLLSKYEAEAKTKQRAADRAFHELRERWSSGSGYTVARVESNAIKDPAYQSLLAESDAASLRADYIKNLVFMVKNRLKALEQLANHERLEQRLDASDTN